MSEYIYNNIKTVVLDLSCKNKESCLEKMSYEMAKVIDGIEADEIYSLLRSRELFGSTALGGYFALPHAKTDKVSEVVGGIFRIKSPIDFGSIDGLPTQLFFILIAPSHKPSIQLKALARISKIFKDTQLKESILSAEDSEYVISLVKEKDINL